jgi:hypothetical protein
MKRLLILACILIAGCPEDGSSGIFLPGFSSPSAKPKATATPTPTPKPGTVTPSPTPKPGTATPTPVPGTVTPTPGITYVTPKVQLGAMHDVWSVCEPMSTLRVGLVAWVHNSKIYAADGDGYGTMEEYTPSQGIWRAGPYFRESHFFGVAGLIGDKLYHATGFEGNVYYSNALEYDHTTGAIKELTALPIVPSLVDPAEGTIRGRSHAAGGVLRRGGVDYLYLVGGTAANYVLPQMARFTPPNGTYPNGIWNDTYMAPPPDLSAARAAMGYCVYNNRLYIAGGYNSQRVPLDTMLMFTPDYETWSTGGNLGTFPSMHKARHSLMMATANGYLYAIGGADANNNVLGDVERYDPITNTWKICASLPTPRALGAAVTLNNRIYVLGGYDQCGRPLRSVEVYDP